MTHFIVVYDTNSSTLLKLETFSEADASRALVRKLDLELEHAKSRSIEIALLESADEATLHVTHGRYFESVPDLAARFGNGAK